MQLTFGTLCTGIGGIDLGFQQAGLTLLWQAENDPYANRILEKHWPNTPNHGDIRNINWHNVEPVDILAAGYPCQPFSHAGPRHGTNDSNHLWPHIVDAIRILRPQYTLLENVTGHLSLGFGNVLADMAQIGYNTQWDCIPAAAVGAPHLRDRVFIIARQQRPQPARTLAHTNNTRPLNPLPTRWHAARTSSPHQQPTKWAPEPNVDRVANGIPNRMDRMRTLGNAVVPQVAKHLAHIIQNLHQSDTL